MSTLQRRIGKYELQELLGRGEMAEVWKALDTQLQRYVAIKLLHADLQNDPDFLKRFEREARVVASLRHPNIVHVHDFQIASSPEAQSTIAYMVMDYIEGPTLADYIASTSRVGKFPSAIGIVNLFASIAMALDYAHRKGMIHRDITPANILLDKYNTSRNPMGEPILTDFGIAKLLGTSAGTLSGSLMSAPLYISPEQAQGSPGNERSDLYALGIILYEVCTGALPFQGDTAAITMMQHINATPTPPHLINQHVSPALEAVIMRSLAKDPATRFPNASAMIAALAEAFHVPVPAELSSPDYSVDTGAAPTHPNSSRLSRPVSLTPSVNASSSQPSVAPIPHPSFLSSSPPTPVLSPPPLVSAPASKKRQNRMLLALVLVLLVVLIGSGLGVFFLLPRGDASQANQVVGHAFFVSSGQLNETNSAGLSDELQINLQNIPAPDAAKSYYAWLLGDRICDPNSNNPNLQCDPKDPKKERVQTPVAPLLLGRLPFNDGTVRFLYPGDSHSTNLSSFASRLVITEESSNSRPAAPSSLWRFYAEFPQAPSLQGAQRYSGIHGIRGLLYETSTLKASGIHGGLDIRFLRDVQKVLELASSARDAWGIDPNLIHRQLVRILDYIDGAAFVKGDVPADTPILADQRLATIPLYIRFPLIRQDGNFQIRMNGHLQEIIDGPDTPAGMRALATQLKGELNNTLKWFIGVRQDAKQLVFMNNTQLSQPSARTLLADMQAQANYALIGQVDPNLGKVDAGAVQIHYSIQLLATFTVRPYSSH